MATFPSVEASYGASKAHKPKVTTVQFGDGYSQRLRVGINQDPQEWRLSWNNILESDSDTIEDFLIARAGSEYFDWSPPDTATSYKWICQSWNKTISYSGRATINATFTQVFEP